MRYIELFAGIGGFRYGLEAVNGTQDRGSQTTQKNGNSEGHKELESPNAEGRRPSEYSNDRGCEEQFTCVYANEFNKYAAQIYEKNYEKPDTRDIRDVPTEEIPDHDLLTAGFPCQSFSIAGKRGGFEDTRGTLFFEIARIAKQKQPRLLLLENVKGLLSHDKGKTFGTILNTLDELGYDLQWQVLNSKNFGVPQNRERVFIVGHLRGTSRPEVFPIGAGEGKDIKEITKQVSDAQRIYDVKGSAKTLKGLGGGLGAKTGLYDVSYAIDANYWKGTSEKDFKEKKRRQLVYTPKVRRLTPTECERLQGFPDGWTEGVSDTQRYKCLGNAVTTNVVKAIASRLKS